MMRDFALSPPLDPRRREVPADRTPRLLSLPARLAA
jgi:hypothetical protein